MATMKTMTKEQYINPECEKFTISGVDYYVHPEFSPLGISMQAETINVRTGHIPKPTKVKKMSSGIVCAYRKQGNISMGVAISVRRMLAIAFIIAKEGCYTAGRKYGDDDSVTIDNTEWSSCRKESLISVNLVSVLDSRVLHSFPSLTSAEKFIQENQEWRFNFIKSIRVVLSSKRTLMSKCKNYQLISA